jgi:hypothetical protein
MNACELELMACVSIFLVISSLSKKTDSAKVNDSTRRLLPRCMLL